MPIIELAAMCVMVAALLMNLAVKCSELGPLVRGVRDADRLRCPRRPMGLAMVGRKTAFCDLRGHRAYLGCCR